MMLGKIDWFGGFNNKKNKINNFGFIIPLEGENTEGIYLRRDDVSPDIQGIIEGRKGEGIYVKFEIDSRFTKAINLTLLEFIGIINTYKQGSWYIDYEDYQQIELSRSINAFQRGDIVSFVIQEVQGKKYAIPVSKLNDLNDEQTIANCANSLIFLICKQFIAKYLLSLPSNIAEVFIINKLKCLGLLSSQEDLIREIVQNAPTIMLASSQLRSYLKCTQFDSNSYGNFINRHLYSVEDSLRQELIDELLDRLKIANDQERSIYWHQVGYLQKNVDYNNFLWDLAPVEIKRPIIQRRFKKLLDIISGFDESIYPYSGYISDNYQKLYVLEQSEESLIRKWEYGRNHSNFISAQMISARGAEKLVIQFYQRFGYQVEDISIHQVTNESQDWRQGDVRLNSSQLLDVKNSRTSVNSDSYSEFCIPTFKESRGNDVKIVAVLSPYLQLQYMRGIAEPKFSVHDPKILGSFDKTLLTKLEEIFSDSFISINMPRDRDINKYLPPWLFDYNLHFYEQQDQIIRELEDLEDEDIPNWEDMSSVAYNFLPVFIAAKRPLPQSWVNNLPQWQVSFINSLIDLPTKRITLPFLFLSILRHFLSMLSYTNNDYSPQRYLEILYTSSSTIVNPLKLYDPLNIIKDFCDTLQVLWNNRQSSRLHEFKIFRFSGQGLLQGKRVETDNLTTILAYCGGRIEKKGKCGYRPLVIGQHQNCPNCGRIICPKCDFCSKDCKRKTSSLRQIINI